MSILDPSGQFKDEIRTMVGKLEDDILHYDRILFFESEKLMLELCYSRAAQRTKQKVLVLIKGRSEERIRGHVSVRYITEEEAVLLKSLYYTYGFSDKFRYISESHTSYAGVYNFAVSGLLSREEICEALLS